MMQVFKVGWKYYMLHDAYTIFIYIKQHLKAKLQVEKKKKSIKKNRN